MGISNMISPSIDQQKPQEMQVKKQVKQADGLATIGSIGSSLMDGNGNNLQN